MKLKTADFRLRTRAKTLEHATVLADDIFATGRALLQREADGTRFRLIGIGVSNFDGTSARADLIEAPGQRTGAREQAVDRLRQRFGRDAVVRGLAFKEDDVV